MIRLIAFLIFLWLFTIVVYKTKINKYKLAYERILEKHGIYILSIDLEEALDAVFVDKIFDNKYDIVKKTVK